MNKLDPNDMIGVGADFGKTVSESDVYLFAGVAGEFDPLHTDEEYCKTTPYGRRIAQGALVAAFMMSAATRAAALVEGVLPSIGIDRLRHTAPLFIGDTVRVRYTFTHFDNQTMRGRADVVATNQNGVVVGVATHVFKVLPKQAS